MKIETAFEKIVQPLNITKNIKAAGADTMPAAALADLHSMVSPTMDDPMLDERMGIKPSKARS